MTLPLPNPQTFVSPRLEPAKLIAIANSDVSWSFAKTKEYANIKGIKHIIQIPMGSDPEIWLADNNILATDNPEFYIDRVRRCIREIVKAIDQLGVCHGIIAGPGVPCRTWLYSPNQGQATYVPLLPFLANAPNLKWLINQGQWPIGTGNFIGGNYNAGWWEPIGASGRVYNLEQPKEFNTFEGGEATWRFRLNYPNNTSLTAITDGTGTLGARIYKSSATGRFGFDNNTLPIGRVGWSSGYRIPEQGTETANNCLNPTYSWEAAKNITAQPGPILVALDNTNSNYNNNHANLIASMQQWGFNVQWYYRLGSPQALQESLAPEAQAAFPRANFENGTLVNYSYYVHIGIMDNADVPGTQLLPLQGGGAHLAGQSNTNVWGYNALARGGAWSVIDCTHRTATDRDYQVMFYWHLLAGLSVMEALYWSQSGFSNHQLACGDPLAAPFNYRRGATNNPYETVLGTANNSLINTQRAMYLSKKRKRK